MEAVAVIEGMDKKNFLRLTMPRFGKRSPKERRQQIKYFLDRFARYFHEHTE